MPRALIIWGGWEGHEPKACAAYLADMLTKVGFTIETSDTLAILDDADRIKRKHVIIPCWTMGHLTPSQEAGLVSAIESGVGLAGFHGGMGDAFRASTAYQFMVGGQFVAHPGDMTSYDVRIIDPQHPITQGIGDFSITTEQYYMHVDPSNRVLATTTFGPKPYPWIDGVVMPVVWTREYGKGRIAYCSIGHSLADIKHRKVREIIRRSMIWAADAPASTRASVVG